MTFKAMEFDKITQEESLDIEENGKRREEKKKKFED